jgi:integrase
MAALKLSKSVVETLSPRATTYIAFDAELPGFGVRVTPAGAKSWIAEYRPGSGGRRVPKKRVTLGSVATLLPDHARKAAKDILARARLGEDEAADRASRRNALSISELAQRYLKEDIRPIRKPSTAALYEIYIRLHIDPAIGRKLADDVTHNDLARLHRTIGTTAPVTANRVLKFMSALLAWAVRVGERKPNPNPASGVRLFKEEGKERFLSAEELARLGETLREAETAGLSWVADAPYPRHTPRLENRITKISPHVTAAVRLLLFTGCRLREILHLKWSQIDFDRQMLFLPDSKTGRKVVVLSNAAISILKSLERIGNYVVVGDDLSKPRHDLHRPWKLIVSHAGLPGLRIHDLRHSFAAMGAGRGLSLQILGKLLGHKNIETTSRYAHLAADPVKFAADSIADQLAAALDAKQ